MARDKREHEDHSAPFTSNGVATGLDLGPILCAKGCHYCKSPPTRPYEKAAPATKLDEFGKPWCGKCDRTEAAVA